PGALLGRWRRIIHVAHSLALDLDTIHPAPERLQFMLLTTAPVRPHRSVRKAHEHHIPGPFVPHYEDAVHLDHVGRDVGSHPLGDHSDASMVLHETHCTAYRLDAAVVSASGGDEGRDATQCGDREECVTGHLAEDACKGGW